MKKIILAAALFAAFGHAPASFATNWFQLQNSEAPDAAAYKFWGFIQPQFVHNEGGAIASNALSGAPGGTAYNGKTSIINLVGPDLTDRDQFQIFRARPGVRGVIPGTDQKINYFLLGELGHNGLTVNGPNNKRSAVFTDATVSFNYIPGARIRVGLGRLPIGEEAMLGEPAMDYIGFTGVTDGLLNERFEMPYTSANPKQAILGVKFNPLTPGGAAGAGQLAGSVGAFRDTGIEVFDWFTKDKWEYSYALMLSRANGVNFTTANNPGNHDVTGRLQASYIFGGSGPKREDATAYIWRQEGKRNYAGTDYNRIREGVGAKYVHDKLRLSGEYIQGSGMIYIGLFPQFNYIGGVAFEPVQLMAVESSNKANGYYLDMGWKFTPQIEADLRYDMFDKMTNSAYDERRSDTWTLGGQYFYSPAMRFSVNYAIRKAEVVTRTSAGYTAAQQTQLNNNTAVLNSMGNVLSAQMTYQF